MTLTTTLTTSWQRVSTGPSVFATFNLDGEAFYAFATAEPTTGQHSATDGTTISAQTDQDLWVKLSTSDDSGSVNVDEASGPVSVGLLSIAPRISVVSIG